MGAKVFVVAPRGPGGDNECYIDMWNLICYCLEQMHDRVVERGEMFAVVWVQMSNHRIWPVTAMMLKRQLHERYGRFLEALHVVHPSWSVRVLRLGLWPIASEEFWDQFECHERVEFLEPGINLRKLALPQDIYEYDKFLDKQAEEMSKQMASQMHGGSFGGIGERLSRNDPESKKTPRRDGPSQETLGKAGLRWKGRLTLR